MVTWQGYKLIQSNRSHWQPPSLHNTELVWHWSATRYLDYGIFAPSWCKCAWVSMQYIVCLHSVTICFGYRCAYVHMICTDLAPISLSILHFQVLTGDTLLAAKQVCNTIGMPSADGIEGHNLAAMEADQFLATVCRCSIFAKVTPQQKVQIVMTLQKNDHIVGFLGDGTNDALALRKADVGVSVDSGASCPSIRLMLHVSSHLFWSFLWLARQSGLWSRRCTQPQCCFVIVRDTTNLA